MESLARRMAEITLACAFLTSAATPVSAAPQKACALIPLTQVNSLLGGGTTIEMDVPPHPQNGAVFSSCIYDTPEKFRTILQYAVYSSPAGALSAYHRMQQRWQQHGRGQDQPAGVKGDAFVVFGVSSLSSRSLNMPLSRKLLNAALAAL